MLAAMRDSASAMAHLLGGLGFAGGSRIQINTGKGFAVCSAQEHHAGMWDAIALPIADTGHGKAKDA